RWLSGAARAFGPCGEPSVKAGGDEATGRGLLRRGRRREVVGVLVLRMTRVSLHPLPLVLVAVRGRNRVLPQLQVLDRARLAFPAVARPAEHPRRHAIDDVPGIRREQHAEAALLGADGV